jgi:hypothetical protein
MKTFQTNYIIKVYNGFCSKSLKGRNIYKKNDPPINLLLNPFRDGIVKDK